MDIAKTRETLLVRLKDLDDSATWEEFAEIYTPLIYRFLRKRGLQESDAADVTQETLYSVARAIQKFQYDRSRGTFRSWLFTAARSRLSDFFAARSRQVSGTGDTGVNERLYEYPADGDEQEWDREYEQRLFEWASREVQNEFEANTWQAFWRTAIEQRPSSEVADSLGISTGAVYVAKSRVTKRIKERIRDSERRYSSH